MLVGWTNGVTPVRILILALAFGAILIPGHGYGLGLGEIEVRSALNQELKAEIALLSASPEDAESLIVKLASRDEFIRASLDRPYFLNSLKFKTEIRDGQPVIIVSTPKPVREPYLNFLVEIDWPKGHLLREYTILLDPPIFMGQEAGPVSGRPGAEESRSAPRQVQPQSTPSSNGGFRPTSDGGFRPTSDSGFRPGSDSGFRPSANNASLSAPQQTAAIASRPQATATPATPTQYRPVATPLQRQVNRAPAGGYRIRAGDTAWSLADAMRPDRSVSIEQMMLAMLRTNPEIFINGNINGLKRGYILRVPDRTEITSINQAEAVAVVQKQHALWREYQQALASSQPSSGLETSGSRSGSAGVSSGSDARLAIVSAGTGASASGSSKDATDMNARELRAQLALAQEQLETQRLSNQELQDQVGTLEQRVDKMKSLLSIVDSEMAATQNLGTSEDSVAEAPVTDEPVAEAPVVEEAEAETSLEPESAIAGLDAAVETAVAEADEMMAEAVAAAEEAMEAMQADATEEETETAAETEEDIVFVDEQPADEQLAGLQQAAEQMAVDSPELAQTQADLEQALRQEFEPPQSTNPVMAMFNNPVMVAGAGGGLLMIMGLVYAILKRRRGAASEFATAGGAASSLDDVADMMDDDLFADDLPDDAAVEAAREISEKEQQEDEHEFDADATLVLPMDEEIISSSNEDTIVTQAGSASDDEVRDDVIAEADVYLAYGIHQQAEELLENAIKEHPKRDDYRVKLAETHFASKSPEAFIATATALQAQSGSGTSAWQKVLVMGKELCPDEAMFQGEVPALDLSVDDLKPKAPEMDIDLGADAGGDLGDDFDLSLDEPLEKGDTALPTESSDDDLAFDLDDAGGDIGSTDAEDEFSLDIDAAELDMGGEITEVAEATSSEADDMDFDLDLSADLTDDVSSSLDVADDLEAAAADLDFSLEDSGMDEIVADSGEIDMELSLDASELELDTSKPLAPSASDDLDDMELSDLGDVDEVSTKLDLAKAYLDMGDSEGTRSILDEVMAEGSDGQKQEAQQLLSQMG